MAEVSPLCIRDLHLGLWIQCISQKTFAVESLEVGGGRNLLVKRHTYVRHRGRGQEMSKQVTQAVKSLNPTAFHWEPGS